jgi:hypothetical protein
MIWLSEQPQSVKSTGEPCHLRDHPLGSGKSWSCICWSILFVNLLLLAGCAAPPSPKSGKTLRPVKLENGYAILTDAPRCRFKWIYWSFTNTKNPILFTRDTLDRSIIGIMRVPVGATLPNGKTQVRSGMNFQDLVALLKENLQNRPDSSIDYESIVTTTTKVAGHQAVLLAYRTTATPPHQGLECAFQKGGWLYYFLFSTIDDFRYAKDSHDFESVLATFKVLQ